MKWRVTLALCGGLALVGTGASSSTKVRRHGDHEHAKSSVFSPNETHVGVMPMCNETISHPNCIRPVDVIVPANDQDSSLRLCPSLGVSSHHSHGHGNSRPVEQLNETELFSRKGPMALSYIEWDFANGMGKLEELHRFTGKEAEQLLNNNTQRAVIGSVQDRWRTLADWSATNTWWPLLLDIRSRIGDGSREPGRYPGLFAFYSALVILSGFILLPLLLCLQVAQSSLVPFISTLYLVMITFTNFIGSTYFALTPALYPPNAYSGLVSAIYWMSIACFGFGAVRFIGDLFHLLRIPSLACSERFSMVFNLLTGKSGRIQGPMVLHDIDTELPEQARTFSSTSTDHTLAESVDDKLQSPHGVAENEILQRTESPSEYTYPINKREPQASMLHRMVRSPGLVLFLEYLYAVVTRSIVLLTFTQVYVGIAIYTGSCRTGFTQVCLAHGIKGAVFFWYGILTFVRYLGAFGEFGWAWNLRPTVSNSRRSTTEIWRKKMPSGEFLECFAIFFYGITNTWMERIGANPGEPYSVKQIQHISIAVMFWFVGLIGMGLEMNSLRTLVGYPIAKLHPAAVPATEEADVVSVQRAPPSYVGSFNPFPALVIGVTGITMATHHQDYVYEVQIHMLWGLMLAVFSMMRIVTYIILWLRPPTSVLPSRPPSEAIASFALTLGGLLFMLSNEEVSFAAMRSGYGDFMAILNVSISLVGLVFCWAFCIMVIKAWASRREEKRRLRTHEMEQAFMLDDPQY